MFWLYRYLYLVLLLSALLVFAGCDSQDSAAPAPDLQIQDLSVSDRGELRLSWTDTDAENPNVSYIVERRATSSAGIQERRDSVTTQQFAEIIPGFLGGDVTYTVSAVNPDTVLRDASITRSFAIPAIMETTSRVSSGVNVRWNATPFTQTLDAYELIEVDSVGNRIAPLYQSSNPQDTSYTVPFVFGESAQNVRLVTTRASNAEADPQPEVGPVAELSFGVEIPEHNLVRYASSIDAFYLIDFAESPRTYLVDSENGTLLDSIDATIHSTRDGSPISLLPGASSSVERLDPETFEVIQTYDAQDIPDFRSFSGNPLLLSGDLLVYETDDVSTSGEVQVYDLQNAEVVGRTTDGASARVVTYSYGENFFIANVEGQRVLFEIEATRVREVGSVPETTFTWVELADGSDGYAVGSGGTVSILRASNQQVVSTYNAQNAFTHLRYDPVTRTLGLMDAPASSANKMTLVRQDAPDQTAVVEFFDGDTFDYVLRGGYMLYDAGQMVNLTPPL